MLLDQIRPHRGTLILGGLLGLVGGAGGLAMPLLARQVIDAFGRGQSLIAPVLAITAAVVLGALVSTTSGFILQRMGENIVLGARRNLIGHMLRLRVPDVDRMKPGDLLSRVSSDTTLLRQVCTDALVTAVTSAFMFGGALILMAVLDWLMLVVVLGVIALAVLINVSIFPRIRRLSLAVQVSLGEMSSRLDRSLQAFRTVKASGAESRETAAVNEAAQQARDRGVSVAKWQSAAEITSWM